MGNVMNKICLSCAFCLLAIIVFLANTKHTSFAGNVKSTLIKDFFVKNYEEDDDDDDNDSEGNEDDDDDETHNAGKNCLTSGCHSDGKEHAFSVGGTIYDDIYGTNARSGATIKVTDANGKSVLLTSDNLGNFYSERNLTTPLTISASYRGRTVTMPISASDGGCNSDGCHTTSAEGRIFINTNDLDLTGTVTGESTGGTSSEISYTGDIKSILDAKCISCHKEGGAKSDVPLTTYTEVTDESLVTPGSADSLLLRKLNKNLSEGTMWPKLNSTNDYEKINDWVVKYNAQENPSGQASSEENPVSRAKVSLSKNGRIAYRTKTNPDGEFTIKKVKAGTYILKISKRGYQVYSESYQMNQTNVSPLEITLTGK